MKSTFKKVYEIVSQIPYGKVTSYGQIALLLGNPRLARVVGYALHTAPENLPCHRVVTKEGKLSPVFMENGQNRQRILLEQEGVMFTGEGTVQMHNFMWYG